MLNALTIDVEEHFQVHAFETVIDRKTWDQHESRVVESTRRILRLLREFDTKATFFILGWVAERHPYLVTEIATDGHEIATHGYEHELVYRQTPDEFRADLDHSLAAIRAACSGAEPQIMGYRAPAFSITRESLWALDILQELGLVYDSSIFPLVAHDRYGIPDADRFATCLHDTIWEFPVSTIRRFGRNLPTAGGGYFRLYPLRATKWSIRHINGEGYPAVIYLHPWEFDPEQPRIANAPMVSKFRHYVNIDKTEDRLRRLLGEFEFGPMCEVFSTELRGEKCALPS